jgi:hypothetical protein
MCLCASDGQTEAEEKLAKATERITELESEASGAKRAKDSISGEAAAYEKKAKLLEDKLVSLTAQVSQLQVHTCQSHLLLCMGSASLNSRRVRDCTCSSPVCAHCLTS